MPRPLTRRKPKSHPHEFGLMKVAVAVGTVAAVVLVTYALTNQRTEAETQCQLLCKQQACGSSKLPLGLSCDMAAYNACYDICAPPPPPPQLSSAVPGDAANRLDVVPDAPPPPPPPAAPKVMATKNEVDKPFADLCNGAVELNYHGFIVANAQTSVTYQWERADGQVTAPHTEMTQPDGLAEVNYGWLASSAGDYSVKLHVTAPNDVSSVVAQASVVACPTPPPPVYVPPPPPPPLPPPPPPPPAPTITWIDSYSGQIHWAAEGTYPPAGWRYDPFGGQWMKSGEGFLALHVDNFATQSTATCGTSCTYCKSMCQVQKNICNYGAACSTDYNACVNVCYSLK